jgi:protein TonB
VQNSIEILESQREVRSGRPRRAKTNTNEPLPAYSSEVQPASVLQSVAPSPTERAVRARVKGTVGVRVLVGVLGRAARVYVTRRLGSGLDQRAVQAVMQYKFKPAMQSALPQTSWLDLEVTYQ